MNCGICFQRTQDLLYPVLYSKKAQAYLECQTKNAKLAFKSSLQKSYIHMKCGMLVQRLKWVREQIGTQKYGYVIFGLEYIDEMTTNEATCQSCMSLLQTKDKIQWRKFKAPLSKCEFPGCSMAYHAECITSRKIKTLWTPSEGKIYIYCPNHFSKMQPGRQIFNWENLDKLVLTIIDTISLTPEQLQYNLAHQLAEPAQTVQMDEREEEKDDIESQVHYEGQRNISLIRGHQTNQVYTKPTPRFQIDYQAGKKKQQQQSINEQKTDKKFNILNDLPDQDTQQYFNKPETQTQNQYQRKSTINMNSQQDQPTSPPVKVDDQPSLPEDVEDLPLEFSMMSTFDTLNRSSQHQTPILVEERQQTNRWAPQVSSSNQSSIVTLEKIEPPTNKKFSSTNNKSQLKELPQAEFSFSSWKKAQSEKQSQDTKNKSKSVEQNIQNAKSVTQHPIIDVDFTVDLDFTDVQEQTQRYGRKSANLRPTELFRGQNIWNQLSEEYFSPVTDTQLSLLSIQQPIPQEMPEFFPSIFQFEQNKICLLAQTKDGYIQLYYGFKNDQHEYVQDDINDKGYPFQLQNKDQIFIEIVKPDHTEGQLVLEEFAALSREEFRESVSYQQVVNKAGQTSIDSEIDFLFQQYQSLQEDVNELKRALRQNISKIQNEDLPQKFKQKKQQVKFQDYRWYLKAKLLYQGLTKQKSDQPYFEGQITWKVTCKCCFVSDYQNLTTCKHCYTVYHKDCYSPNAICDNCEFSKEHNISLNQKCKYCQTNYSHFNIPLKKDRVDFYHTQCHLIMGQKQTSKQTLACQICEESEGVKVSCPLQGCESQSHLLCAYFGGLEIKASLNADLLTVQAKCVKHTGVQKQGELATQRRGQIQSDHEISDIPVKKRKMN